MMDKFIYNEINGLWYELQGDYYLPCLKLPEEEWRISAYGDSGLSFLMFFIELVLFSSQYLILRGGGMLYFTMMQYIRRKGVFELEHIKESREDEKNDWYMSGLLC